MAEQNNENNKDLHPAAPGKPAPAELDAAGKSLSEALNVSFIILKVIMIVLVVAFLASGFETVDSDEQALVLRFGKIRGVGEKRLLGPGAHWIFPYPIDEIVKIPVETQVNLAIDSFWYFQTSQEKLSGVDRKVPLDSPLNPLRDGYCITRSEKASEAAIAAQKRDDTILRAEWDIFYQDGKLGAELKDFYVGRDPKQPHADYDGSDYNIVHTKWQLTYQIDDPECFFRNVYVEDINPGDIYFDVITRNITPLLENLFEDVVVTEMVNYTIDEAISSLSKIPTTVKGLLQKKLEEINSGIKVVSVQLTNSQCPRQVKDAFEASLDASQTSQTAITNAKTYAENTTIEATALAQEKITQARVYRTKVVANVRANADYLQELLPEYRQRPKLVIQEIYLDAIEQILENADEKFFISPDEDEIRTLLNRDPSLKPKTSKEQTTREN
jgi:regulator of protease activity HflC (stomatin/prohibitin superfamily)